MAGGQSCAAFTEALRPGSLLEYTLYDEKDKVSGTTTYRVERVVTVRDTVVAVTDVTIGRGRNDNKPLRFSVPIKCHGDVIYYSMRGLMPVPEVPVSGDMRMEVRGGELGYPASLQVGQRLPDAEMEIIFYVNDVALISQKQVVTDRVVEGRASVTTEAGTFDCFKITFTTEFTGWGMQRMRSELWYAPKVGTVKMMQYNKKNDIESRMELTGISR
ncbi:MAG: hypothetical protein NZL95_06115 [Chitinophagales bacterium]|nr:hypothetical protein [Chitinophagales bacterium]MDW8428111.1 hypothetical protein [Chitinophagales bacterium]